MSVTTDNAVSRPTTNAGQSRTSSAAQTAAQTAFGNVLSQEETVCRMPPQTSSPPASNTQRQAANNQSSGNPQNANQSGGQGNSGAVTGQGNQGGQNSPGTPGAVVAAGAHAMAEGAIWNPIVAGSVSRDAAIARDTSRGVWVERFLGNTNNATINRMTGSLGRYTAAADRATSTVVQQIKSTSNLNKAAQITRDATRDAARFIANDAAYAGRAAQARIVMPTGTPGTAVDSAKNALNGLRRPIPGAVAAPKVTTGLPGVGGVALKALAPLGAVLSARSFGEDLAKGDVAGAVSNGAGMVAGGLETFALASTAVGASGTTAAGATAVGVGLGGTATGAAALAAEAAPVVAAFGIGVAAGTYINNHTGISDTAARAGTWVEKHTGGSVIAGATAAAATAIVTTPYYATVAAADAVGSAGRWVGSKISSLFY